MLIRLAILALTLSSLPALADEKTLEARGQWGEWRGPLASGVAPEARPPVYWSEERNIRFKVAIPGKGHSTPVVWGDRLFLTTAEPYGEPVEHQGSDSHGAHDNMPPRHQLMFKVLALDRRDGSVLWDRTVRKTRPHESAHESGSWASNSAVTDGKHVIASFGSNGLYALDMNGKLVWHKDLGEMRVLHGHGEGSSPALHGDTLVVNWDHQGESFIVALDKNTGQERWRVTRDEESSWSTPLIVEHDGKQQVIVSATRRVRAYDLANGRTIWECAGLSGNVVASPVARDGMVFVANSYETRSMLAIRLAGAAGDISGTDAVVWRRERDTPYVPSPVLYGDSLCFLKHYQGLVTCVDPSTGTPHFGPTRIPGIGNVYASLVGAMDRIYIVDLGGTTAVIRRGPEFDLLATNRLDDSFAASPVLVGDALYLRGERYLYCIAETTGK